MEVGIYVKELCGVIKEKESLLQMVCGLSKLCNLGQGYVNFGELLLLMIYFNQYVLDWWEVIDLIEVVCFFWLMLMVNSIVVDLMVCINNVGVVNVMNLCCMVLLVFCQCLLICEQFIQQLECYFVLLCNVFYFLDVIVLFVLVSEFIDYVLQMNKFEVEKDIIGDIIILLCEQVVLMIYYCNNIIYMLVMLLLLVVLVIQYCYFSCVEVLCYVEIFYLFFKVELFLCWEKVELVGVVDVLIVEMLCQELIVVDGDVMSFNLLYFCFLQLLVVGVCEMLQCYVIIFWLLSVNLVINCSLLEKESCIVVQCLLVLYGINVLEFFDKVVFSILVLILCDEGYISDIGDVELEEILKVYWMLVDLIMLDV